VIAEEPPAVTVTPPNGTAVGATFLPTYPEMVAAEIDGAAHSKGTTSHTRMSHRLETAVDRGRIRDDFTGAAEFQIVIESWFENQQICRVQMDRFGPTGCVRFGGGLESFLTFPGKKFS